MRGEREKRERAKREREKRERDGNHVHKQQGTGGRRTTEPLKSVHACKLLMKRVAGGDDDDDDDATSHSCIIVS